MEDFVNADVTARAADEGAAVEASEGQQPQDSSSSAASAGGAGASASEAAATAAASLPPDLSLKFSAWERHTPPETLDHVVRLRGLHTQPSAVDIVKLLSDVAIACNGLLLCVDGLGTGYVATLSLADKERALKRSKNHIGMR